MLTPRRGLTVATDQKPTAGLKRDSEPSDGFATGFVATDQKPTAGLKQIGRTAPFCAAMSRDGPETHCGIET